jgi:hypothetical protein
MAWPSQKYPGCIDTSVPQYYMYILYLVIKAIFSWTRSSESVVAAIFNYLLLIKPNPKHTKPEQPKQSSSTDGPVSQEQYK